MNDLSQAATDSVHDRWARLRFAIIGPLLASPPDGGELKEALLLLAKKSYRHPVSNLPVSFGVSTIERWYYRARHNANPVGQLKTKRRADAGQTRALTPRIKLSIHALHKAHPGWSYQLLTDNLRAQIAQDSTLGLCPSYASVRRYMKSQGLIRQPRVRRRDSPGAQAAADRLESREVRSYEVDYVHGLWHLDFHHGSRKILSDDGQWHKPLLLAILDDRSRVICHAQWYLDETAETLVHGFCQAIQKRALPRALMSDNGAAMTSAAFTQGLERLGILHQPTLPFSPYQNAKQEVLWAQVEGRLMAMLEGEPSLTLALLNQATQAWVEREYHLKVHSEIGCAPLERYRQGPEVGRESPSSDALRDAFREQVKRKQRRSDGTLSLAGKRFEIPSAFRHLEVVQLRYAPWNLRSVSLIDPQTNAQIVTLYPLDKSVNAEGLRRKLTPQTVEVELPPEGISPLLKQLMSQYAATGLPPAYLPKGPAHE